tara:strand:+ start:307 stop:552 length:246 start_codon:yes stop_codon:yes gene_type:complete
MDQKEKIKKVLGNFVKNHNIFYKNAKDKRIKNRKEYDQNKKTKQLQKSLSKDRFNTYLDSIYKEDPDSTHKASDSTYKEKK